MSDYIEVDGLRIGPAMYRQRMHERDRIAELLVKAEDERDALAAHVEDVRDAYGRKIAGLTGNDERSARLVAVGRVLTQSPAISLARLKAEWQAEALERIQKEAIDMFEAESVRAFLRNRARKLRRQAEEPNQ